MIDPENTPPSSEPADRLAAINVGAADSLDARITRVEETLERLAHRDFYGRSENFTLQDAHVANVGQDRFISATSDGWLVVLVGGSRTSIASGLKVSLTNTRAGRDYCVISEGVTAGTKFDVTSGHIDAAYRRVSNLVITVGKRAGGPVTIGEVAYDLELTLAYTENGVPKSIGPSLAMTDPTNPLPTGTHELEIADFPHIYGAKYGPFGTVWFRIGHSGDRYFHPGRISEGCLTCEPSNWPAIYNAVHAARIDTRSAGTLIFKP